MRVGSTTGEDGMVRAGRWQAAWGTSSCGGWAEISGLPFTLDVLVLSPGGGLTLLSALPSLFWHHCLPLESGLRLTAEMEAIY